MEEEHMKRRFLMSTGVLAVAMGVVSLTPTPAAAQTGTAPVIEGYKAPRTVDGVADLQGVWANNDATPLERPKELAGRKTLTPAEVETLKRRAGELFNGETDAAFGDSIFLAVIKDAKDYKSYEDLKGEVVGAQIGTAYVKPMQDSGMFKEVKVYDTIPDIIRDVNLGRIKAGFADYPIVAYQLSQGSFPDTRLAKGYKAAVVGSVGIAVRKGDKATLDKVNAALRKFRTDGTIDKILERWNLK
jgi:hypothetical protein